MNRTIQIIMSTLVLSLVLSPVALAQTAAGTGQNTPFRDLRESIKEKRVEIRTDARAASTSEDRKTIGEEGRAEIKDLRVQALNAKKKSIIERHIERMANRFEATIGRLERLADRIADRITKLEEKGFVLDEAKAKLADADIAITAALTAAADARTALEAALASDTPKEAIQAAREIVGDVVAAIKEAHAKLVEAVRAIKGSKDSNARKASTTESGTE